MIWTKEPPTEPGWYWMGRRHKGRDSWDIVEVSTFRDSTMYWDGSMWMPLSLADMWAGPIPEPTEPE